VIAERKKWLRFYCDAMTVLRRFLRILLLYVAAFLVDYVLLAISSALLREVIQKSAFAAAFLFHAKIGLALLTIVCVAVHTAISVYRLVRTSSKGI